MSCQAGFCAQPPSILKSLFRRIARLHTIRQPTAKMESEEKAAVLTYPNFLDPGLLLGKALEKSTQAVILHSQDRPQHPYHIHTQVSLSIRTQIRPTSSNTPECAAVEAR